MVSARSQFEAACQLQKFAVVADIQRHLPCKQGDAGGNPAGSSKFDGGIGRMAEALDCDSSYESSILSSRPNWAVRIRGLPTACNRAMSSSLAPSTRLGSGTRRQ